MGLRVPAGDRRPVVTILGLEVRQWFPTELRLDGDRRRAAESNATAAAEQNLGADLFHRGTQLATVPRPVAPMLYILFRIPSPVGGPAGRRMDES